MEEKNKPKTIFICSYGQTGIPICVEPEHKYCKLKTMNSKKCDFRKVVNYEEYKKLEQQLKLKDKIIEKIKIKLAEGFSNNEITYSANSLFIEFLIDTCEQQALAELQYEGEG